MKSCYILILSLSAFSTALAQETPIDPAKFRDELKYLETSFADMTRYKNAETKDEVTLKDAGIKKEEAKEKTDEQNPKNDNSNP